MGLAAWLGGCDEAPCDRDADCDDGVSCTVDVCDPDRGCTHVADPTLCGADGDCATFRCDPFEGCRETRTDDGVACDDDRDLCTTGVCEAGVCEEVPVACDDEVACTDDVCEAGVCVDPVPLDARCDDDDPCTADACDAELGCSHTPLPDFTPCDDGDGATGPDLCRAGRCVGAIQGVIPGDAATRVEGAAMGDGRAWVALNVVGADGYLYEVVDAGEHRWVGVVEGRLRRVRVLGGTVVTVGERPGDTSGGLDCTYDAATGRCPIVGVYSPGDPGVVWNGTPIHAALNGLGLASLRDVARFTDVEPTFCETPPCYDDVHWWFVGERKGRGTRPRPGVYTCLEQSPTRVGCNAIANGYDTGEFTDDAFATVDVSTTANPLDPELATALLGLATFDEATVVVDADGDPGDALGSVRQSLGGFGLLGSVRRGCNSVLFYGSGGAGICTSGNRASFGCETDNVWGCRAVLDEGNFTGGMRAGPTVLTTPSSLFVHVSGDIADPERWTEVPLDLPSGVRLSAITGTNGRWLLFAEDRATDDVRIYELVW